MAVSGDAARVFLIKKISRSLRRRQKEMVGSRKPRVKVVCCAIFQCQNGEDLQGLCSKNPQKATNWVVRSGGYELGGDSGEQWRLRTGW